MKIRSVLSLFAIFIVSLFFTVSCTQSQLTSTSTNSSANLSATSLSMGINNWTGFLPWQVAKAENLFVANNINVDLQWFDDLSISVASLAKGKLNATGQTLNDTLSSLANHADEVVVLVADNSTGSDAIIASEGINSIADLKGKKVAADAGTVDHFLLLQGLKKAGLSQKDIEFIPKGTDAATEAFLAGEVDAVGIYAPATIKALRRPGSKVLFSSQDFPGSISDVLAVNRKVIEQRPQDIQALVNSWFATLDFIKQNHDKSYEIMAERAGVTVEEYKQSDAGVKIFGLEDNLKAFSPGQDMTSLHYAAKESNKFLLANGLIKKEPDLSKLFDDRFVKAYATSHKS